MMERLRNAFSPVPAQVHDRIESTLNQIHQSPPAPARSPRRMLVLAIVLCLLVLAGAAAAASYFGVLDYLHSSSLTEVPESVGKTVTGIQAHETVGSVDVVLHETVFDGMALGFTMTMEADKPTYVIIEDVLINGHSDSSAICSTMSSGWIGNPFEKDMQCQVGAITYLPERISGDAQVTVKLSLLEPLGELVQVDIDNYQSDIEAAFAYIHELALAGKVPVDRIDTDNNTIYNVLFVTDNAVLEQLAVMRGLDPAKDRADHAWEINERYSNLRHTQDVTLSFSLPASSRVSLPVTTYSLSGDFPMDIELHALEFTELSTFLDVTLYPVTEEDQAAVSALQSACIEWLGNDGAYLRFVSVPANAYIISGTPVVLPDGRSGRRVTLHNGGVVQPDDTLHLVFMNEDYNPMEAYTLTFQKNQ